jgi:hypothetical protein
MEWVRKNTTDAEYQLLWSLACGKTYDDLSIELREAPNTLTARLFIR